MRLIGATSDEEMLHAIVGAQILDGSMEYRGMTQMKGFQQFRTDCRSGAFCYGDLNYGYILSTIDIPLAKCAENPNYQKAYRWLNMTNKEFYTACVNQLDTLPEERTHQILDNALEWADAHYDGWELYHHLKDHLGMEDQEISRAGFELDEFYEDEELETEADYEPEDDYGEEL